MQLTNYLIYMPVESFAVAFEELPVAVRSGGGKAYFRLDHHLHQRDNAVVHCLGLPRSIVRIGEACLACGMTLAPCEAERNVGFDAAKRS